MSHPETTTIWSSEFTAELGDYRSELTTIKEAEKGQKVINQVLFDAEAEPLKIYRKPMCLDEPEWIVCIQHVSNNDPSHYSLKTTKKQKHVEQRNH